MLQALEEEGFLLPTNGGKTRIVRDRPSQRETLKPRGKVIALLSPNQTTPSSDHQQSGWADFIALGALQEIQRLGINVMTVGGGSFEEADLEWILRLRPNGVIIPELAACVHPPKDLMERLAQGGTSSVVYSGSEDLASFDRVSSNHEFGAYEITKWLLARGRRKIANVWARQDVYWHAARQRGYDRAMIEAGLTPLPIITFASHQFDSTTRDGFEAMSHYLAGWLAQPLSAEQPIDAIMVESDGIIPPMAMACRILKLEPNKDIWFAGYDNYWRDIPERKWEATIPLITVDKQNWELGRELVRLLLDRIEGRAPAEPQWRLVPPKLVETEAGAKMLPAVGPAPKADTSPEPAA